MHANDGKVAQPVMIRVYNDGHKGATAFFRNRPFLDALFAVLRQRCHHRVRILVHASSIGAEAYSLALWWFNRILPHWHGEIDLDIAATDIDAAFLAFAKEARYPKALLRGMTDEERNWFEVDEDMIVVPENVRRFVRFLQPMSFLDGNPGELFDAVLIMNALTYMSVGEQSRAIRNCAEYVQHALGVTAFHPDQIMDDLIKVGFSPCAQNHREIHQSWGDRLTNRPVPRDSPEYSWRLPPYDDTFDDWLYRFGALFVRNPLL